MPTYRSRREYISSLYQPIIDVLRATEKTVPSPSPEPTGWIRVDRSVDKIIKALETAKNEEDFQTVGLLCREALISLAQAVYDPSAHGSPDGVTPSETDAKRMLEGYISSSLAGGANEAHRRFTKSAYDLAIALQHRRTANFRDAALCAEATRALINTIAVIAGQRDPDN